MNEARCLNLGVTGIDESSNELGFDRSRQHDSFVLQAVSLVRPPGFGSAGHSVEVRDGVVGQDQVSGGKVFAQVLDRRGTRDEHHRW